MSGNPGDFEALLGSISIRREGLPVVEKGRLLIRLAMSGPGAVIETATDHVAVFDAGSETKLDSLGGCGMPDNPGGPFYVWEFAEPRGDTVKVLYTDGDHVIASELVPVVRDGSTHRASDSAFLTYEAVASGWTGRHPEKLTGPRR